MVPTNEQRMKWIVVSLLFILPACLAFVVPTPNVVDTRAARRRAFVAAQPQQPSSSKVLVVASTAESDETVSDDAVSSSDGEDDSEEKRILRVRHTVFLGNLPFDITEAEVSELCSPYGTVSLTTIPKNRESGLPRGFAFVDMSSAKELQAVVDNVDGTQFRGRSLRANISEKGGSSNSSSPKVERKTDESVAKVYVGNIPFTTDREELLGFYNNYVDAIEAYVPMNPGTGTGRGFGFVTVKAEDLEEAIEKTNGVEFQGRPLVVSKPLPPGQRSNRQRQKQQKDQSNTVKLYVGNLAFSTDVGILEEVFGEFGEVLDCYMPEDPERGGSRGFGFITMERSNGMDAIAELNGCELDGRFIRVNEALQKSPRAPAASQDDWDDDDG
ncbi:hypothetical protein ACA910_000839 [Epithemia clementina (nom. ined.)]